MNKYSSKLARDTGMQSHPEPHVHLENNLNILIKITFVVQSFTGLYR